MAQTTLAEKFKHIFAKITNGGRLTDLEIKNAMREVKLALLGADVNFLVVKKFIEKCTAEASGEKVMKSLTPGQMVIKIVRDNLTELLGQTNEKLSVSPKPPTVIMMVGLQGAGKTTFCGKIGALLKSQNKRVLLVACDIYRPAAIEQLKIVGKTANIEVYSDDIKDAVKIAKNGIAHALKNNFDTVIIDTAGRLHIDEALMQELVKIKKETSPTEILLTVDAMTGQDAVNIATKFNEILDVSGVLLTKLDGDMRGGSALSVRCAIGKPIKFCGTGEKLGDIEAFYPDRMANRILGMGDVLSIIEKAETAVSEEELKRMEKAFKQNSFDFNDFLVQFDNVKKMGNLEEMMQNLAQATGGKMKFGALDETQMKRNKAIIQSMTIEERTHPDLIKSSRKKRITEGSGTTIQEINQLIKQFEQSKIMMQQMKGMGRGKMPKFR